MHDPRIDADDRASRDILVADIDTTGWDVAFEQEADAGVYAQCFLDDGLRVGKMGCGLLIADRVS